VSNVLPGYVQLVDHEQAATEIIDVSPPLFAGLFHASDHVRAIMGDEPDGRIG
jgi:hypothetical protein